MQAEMEQLQKRLGEITASGTAGAGYVTVKVNGRMEVTGCTIAEEALKLNDREMLEDLVVAATNQALAKARQAVAEETTRMAGSIGLPGGSNLPPGAGG
jgi:DNA-binding YbaB/EbfC family protein